MTEKDAKKKWCPFARAQADRDEHSPVVNRGATGQPDIDCHCIGSACMAFRFQPARKLRLAPIEDEIETPAECWCGLAGKP